jgi:mannosylglycerate hydrolase
VTIDRLATTDTPLAGDPLAGFRFTIVPHTHWDREWYQPFEVFRLRLARMLDELIEILDTDPEFRTFVLDGQAVILEDYLDLRPERADDLRRLLADGRLVTGPSYVLPDEFLAGQEALVRNLLMGRAVCRRFGAEPMAVGYYPDTFGHVAQLPQILRGFGLDSFVFWRGLGDEGNDVGVAFDWQAPDGSRVLAVRQLGSYGNACAIGRWASGGIDMAARPDLWPEVAAQRLARHVSVFAPEIERTGSREALACNGSDHERAHRRLPELVAAVREAHPDTAVEIGTFAEYVARLRASLPGDRALPVVTGELVSGRDAPVLRGINSTRIYLKQAAERAERTLLQAETLAALARLADPAAPTHADALGRAWRELLRNLPHDSISGCSIDEVHRDMAARFAATEQLARRVTRESLAALAGRTSTWDPVEAPASDVAVVNTLPWRRRVVAEVPLPATLADARALRTSDGAAAQAADDGASAFVEVEVAAFGALDVALVAGDGEARANAVTARHGILDNGRVRVEVAADGTFSIVELASGRRADGLGALEDVADRGDEYNFCPVEGDRPVLATGPARVRVVRGGPVVAEVEIARTLELPEALSVDRRRRTGSVACAVLTRLRLAAGSDVVEARTTVDNRARDHRLRVRFPAPGTSFGTAVRAEGHFAVLRRPPRPIWSSAGWIEPPAPTHHTTGFVAAGDLFVVGRGLPEYEMLLLPDGSQEVALTLLRCVGWLSRDDLATRPGGAGPSVATPDAQCPGIHEFEYAVGLGAERRTDAELVRAAAELRFRPVVGPAGVRTPALAVHGDVGFGALKVAEDGDGAVLRVYNPGGESVALGVEWAGSVEPARLDEAPVALSDQRLGAGEIRTLRLRPAEG